jgi:hypothetical protein
MVRRSLACALAVSLSTPLWAVEPSRPREFSFPKLNRTYKDLVSDFAPIQQGAMTLTLSSPSQTVLLKSNNVTLTPRGDGSYDARVALEFLGKGALTGDLEMAGQGTRLQDELIVPQQTVELTGRVRIEKAETGYSIETLALPAELGLTVKSQIAARFVTWCDRISLVPFTNLDCAGLERSMSDIKVPLPPAGETYVLPFEELGEEERAALDAYLGFD